MRRMSEHLNGKAKNWELWEGPRSSCRVTALLRLRHVEPTTITESKREMQDQMTVAV